MRNKLAVLAACVVMLVTLACNLAVRTATPISDERLSLTVTALTRLLDQTASPVAGVVVATQAAANQTTGPLPTAPAQVRLVTGVSAAYFASPPTIDGQLTEWTSPGFVIASPVYGIENWRGVDDLSGMSMFGWDEDYLYVAVQVTDDVYVQNAIGPHIYKGDSIEILYDANLAGDFYDNALSDDDFQLGFSPGNPLPAGNGQAYQWLPAFLEGARPEITIVAVPTAKGYDLEAVIPWSVLGIQPQAWQHYGLAISLCDNDKVDTVVQQSIISNTPDRRLTKPVTWGDLVLTK